MEAVYQLLKSEFRQFGTGGISLVLALTALLFLMAEWKRLSRGCRMYTAYAACMLYLWGIRLDTMTSAPSGWRRLTGKCFSCCFRRSRLQSR